MRRVTPKERHIGNGWPIVTSLIAFTRPPYDTLGTKSFVPAKWAVGPFYDAAVSTTAWDVRPDFRFAIWPSPLFFPSADRVAVYSGATIG